MPIVLPFTKLISNELADVCRLIQETVVTENKIVDELLQSLDSTGGKMLRPSLVLLSAKCCGKTTVQHIKIAAIMEMLHLATLLHDDVIDQGQKRRHRQTLNALKGNSFAVLCGDFVLTKIFKMCTELDKKISAVIAETTTRICLGEMAQNIQMQNWDLSEDDYVDIIREKSASLFSTCCQLGAIGAAADNKEIEALAVFGLNLGISFQLNDDLLDIVGDEEKLGKNSGSDLAKSKPTLGIINLLAKLEQKERLEVVKKLDSGQYSQKDLMQILKSNGCLEYVRARTNEFSQAAIDSLLPIADSPAKNTLVETVKFLTNC